MNKPALPFDPMTRLATDWLTRRVYGHGCDLAFQRVDSTQRIVLDLLEHGNMPLILKQ